MPSYDRPVSGFRHDANRPTETMSVQPVSCSTVRVYAVGSSCGIANSSSSPESASVARKTSDLTPSSSVTLRVYSKVPMAAKPTPTTWSSIALVLPSSPVSR